MKRAGGIFLGMVLFFLSIGVLQAHQKKLKDFPPVYPPLMVERSIVLTFDDGPRPWILPDIIELLRIHRIRAAFFVQGWQAKEHPDLVKRLWEAGHEVGNHTWNHAPLGWYIERYGQIDGERRYLLDVEAGARVIEDILGGRPSEFFFRPPFWDINEGVYKVLKKSYLIQVLDEPRFRPKTGDPAAQKKAREARDVNTQDYQLHKRYTQSPGEATKVLLKQVRAILKTREEEGIFVHVLVFHELPVTKDALEVLIPEWKKAGHRFCTLRWVYGVDECTRQR